MTTKTILAARGYQPAPAMNYFGAPHIAFEAPNDQGADAEAARAAAAAAEAEAEASAAAEAEAAAAADAAAANDADPEELKAEKAALLKDVMKKKAALKEKDDALAAAQAELAKYKGIDPTKYAALVKAEKDAEEAQALASGDFDRVKQMMAEQHKAEIAAKDEEIAQLRATSAGAAKTIDALTIGNDFASSKFIADNLTLSPAKARVLYGSHFETKDGKTIAYDKPAGEANRTLLVNSSGDPLSFDQAFEKIIAADPDKDSVLKAKVVPGGGSKSKPDAGKAKEQQKQGTEDGLYGRTRLAAHFFKDGK